MTRLQIVSDLHTEFHRDGGLGLVAELSAAAHDADVLVVAGDVATASGLHEALALLCDSFLEVVFVLGNHDLYGSWPKGVLEAMAKTAAALPNLHWLNETTAEVAGLRFAGTPLWFALPHDHRARGIREAISDFRMIDGGYSAWAEEANARARRFLAVEAPRADVVVTHWLPSPASVAPRFRGSALNSYFVSDVSEIVEAAGGLWIHGHTHDSFDYSLGGTRVVCNPFGYPHEVNRAFRPGFVVEVAATSTGQCGGDDDAR